MSDSNKEITRQFYDRFNAGDLTIVDDLVSDDFVEHEVFPGLEPNKTGLRQLFESFKAAFKEGLLRTASRPSSTCKLEVS